ncbi:MAG: hypothetical protein QOF29_3749 [bacterium]
MSRSSSSFAALWLAYAEGRLERSLDLVDGECDVTMLDGRTYHGHDGLREWVADVQRLWKTLTVTFERVDEPYEGCVIGVGRVLGTSTDGAHRLDRRLVCFGEFREGRLVHGRAFDSTDDALRYAGDRAGDDPAVAG